MSKQEIFNYFYTNSANFGIKTILLSMLGGLVISLVIYLTYKESYKGVSYNQRFNVSLVVTNLIAIVIMLMISSNIVISLGMVGALSIVRFRTAIKDSRDTVYMFWSISEGLSVGSGNFKLALITTLFIAIIIMIFSLIPKLKTKYLLIITGGKEEIDEKELRNKIEEFSIYSRLRTSSKSSTHQEMIFEIKTKGELDLNATKAISEIKGIKSVNYIIESGENVG